MKALFTPMDLRLLMIWILMSLLADGFYFTISYPGMTGTELLEELLCYGISAISLEITGSKRNDGLRACVSHVPRRQFGDLETR